MDSIKMRNAKKAFNNAITTGHLSETKTSDWTDNFAGNWMYMYSSEDLKTDYFKNITTRNYIEVPNKEKL